MSKKRPRVRFHLDPGQVNSLPMDEVRVILRAADSLIAAGGRNLLVKILRGSRAKEVLQHGVDQNPVYGSFRDLPVDQVLAKVDWMILHGYLDVIYSGQLPLLVFAPAGWAIERETFAQEIFQGFDTLLASGQRPYPMEFLKDMNREMILRVLEMVQASGDPKYIPLLEDWELVDYKKVKLAIRDLIHRLAGSVAFTPALDPPGHTANEVRQAGQ